MGTAHSTVYMRLYFPGRTVLRFVCRAEMFDHDEATVISTVIERQRRSRDVIDGWYFERIGIMILCCINMGSTWSVTIENVEKGDCRAVLRYGECVATFTSANRMLIKMYGDPCLTPRRVDCMTFVKA